MTGLDSGIDRVGAPNAGRSHPPDVTEAQMAARQNDGYYRATLDASVLETRDVAIITVPPPLGKSKDPDISKHRRSWWTPAAPRTRYPRPRGTL